MKLEIDDPKLAVNILIGICHDHENDVTGKFAKKLLEQLVGVYTDPQLGDVWELTPEYRWACINLYNWNHVPLGLVPVVSDEESLKEITNV